MFQEAEVVCLGVGRMRYERRWYADAEVSRVPFHKQAGSINVSSS